MHGILFTQNCRVCHETQPKSNFTESSRGHFRNICQNCLNLENQAERKGLRRCRTCLQNKELSLENFSKNGKCAKGFLWHCRKCSRKQHRLSHHKFREKRLREMSEYRKKNPEKILFQKARNRATAKNIPFNIVETDIIIPKFCPVLGMKMDGSTRDLWPSLDRIKNNAGYVKGNVCVISYRANSLKSNATVDELKKIIAYIELTK